jgi:hypothetical protein
VKSSSSIRKLGGKRAGQQGKQQQRRNKTEHAANKIKPAPDMPGTAKVAPGAPAAKQHKGHSSCF